MASAARHHLPAYSQAALRLLEANDPPQPFEEAQMRADMFRATENLSSIETEISELQRKLKHLQQRYGELKQFIDDHTLILSPSRRLRLPPELMTEIFRNLSEGFVTTNVNEDLWVVGRVCSYWRSVVLASPSLWNVIHLNNDVPLVEELLSRSQAKPLHIVIEHQPTLPTLIIIARVSERWRSIDFDEIPERYFIQLSPSLRGHVPLLERVTLRSSYIPPNFDWLTDAPSLREFTCEGIADYFHLDVPWSQLRKCIVPIMTAADQQRLLKKCPNLELLDLWDYPNASDTPDAICMPKLRYLGVHYCRNSLTSLLSSLLLPSLTDVSMHYFSDSTIAAFKDIVKRSSCVIRRLEILIQGRHRIFAFPNTSQPVLEVQLLSQVDFHAVTDLRLYGLTCRSITDALTLSSETQIILPCLQNLTVEGPLFRLRLDPGDNIRLHFISLLEMTRSRWCLDKKFKDVVSRLTYLKVAGDDQQFLYHDLSDDITKCAGILAPLLAFRDEGLEIDVNPYFLNSLSL